MKPRWIFWIVFWIAAGVAAEVPAWEAFVSILPQKYFVERIGGDAVHVSVLVLPGFNPASYEPKPRQMALLRRARVYFSVGVPFERNWLPRIRALNPDLHIVPTDAWIRKRRMHGHHAGSHPLPGHRPGFEGTDPHVWLSPPLVMLQARAILDALCRLDPAREDRFERNYRRFLRDIVDLDLEIRRLLRSANGRRFLVFHPSWGYFADTYGLVQVPLEIEGKEPKPRDLKRLIALAREQGIRTVFVQPQFSTKAARTVARAVGGEVVAADPLAEDWPANLREVARKFKHVLQ